MLRHATQLLILLLIVSLASVTVISTMLYVSQINSQREQLSTILETISQIGSDNISKWLDERKTSVETLAQAKLIIDVTSNLKNPELSSQESLQHRLEIETHSTYVHNSWNWLEGLKISDPNTGETIFKFGDAPLANLKEQQHFIDALDGKVALSEIHSSEEPIINEFEEYEKDVPTLLISAPIYSDTGLEGVLTARANVFKIDTGVIKYVTDFHSGDAYIVDSDGVLLSRSAFPQDIVNLVERRPELELRVFDPVNQDFTKLFQNADKNQPITIVDGYNDYRGIPVIGSINSVQDTDWFFIFEIDEAEAYRDFTALQIIVGYSLSILALVVFVIASYFAKSISRPLVSLKDNAEEITKGNLDSPIKEKGSYEISKLSESMEDMRKSVKKAIKTEAELFIAAQQAEVDEQLAKQKEVFSTMITHELKTPLSTIIGYSEMLKNPKMGELNKDQETAIDEIRQSSESLEQLIENIMIAHKLEQEQLSFNIEKVSVKELLKRVYNRLLPLMSEKQIEFLSSTEEDLTTNVDKERMMEVFSNLIQNSVDFVPASGGRIEVAAKSDNSNVLFSVKDNGIGIPKEKLKNLFTKYYQVDTAMTRKHGGSGLGLVICKGIIEAFGGKIWIESEEGKGSIFYFTIPKE